MLIKGLILLLSHFTLAIDKLGLMIEYILETNPNDLQIWGNNKPGEVALETKVKTLLQHIKIAHDMCIEDKGKGHSYISAMIQKIWEKFFKEPVPTIQKYSASTQSNTVEANTAEPTSKKQIMIKLQKGDEIQLVEVNRDISYSTFIVDIQKKFKLDNFKINYKDLEGDTVNISNNNELQAAFTQYDKARLPTLRLFVHPISIISKKSTEKTEKSSNTPEKPSDIKTKPGKADTSIQVPNSGIKRPLKSTDDDKFQHPGSLRDFSFRLDVEQIRKKQKISAWEEIKKKITVNLKELTKLLEKCHEISSSGFISKQEFLKLLESIKITDPFVIETLVSTFDPLKSDKIDSREFISGLTIISPNPDFKSKLSLLFKCYDWDKTGTLTEAETLKLLQSGLKTQRKEINLLPLLRKLYSAEKKSISEDDFVKSILQHADDFNWLIKLS